MAPSPGTPVGGERPPRQGSSNASRGSAADGQIPSLEDDVDMTDAWDSWPGLRAHMDAHQLGGLPAYPQSSGYEPKTWWPAQSALG